MPELAACSLPPGVTLLNDANVSSPSIEPGIRGVDVGTLTQDENLNVCNSEDARTALPPLAVKATCLLRLTYRRSIPA
eukprot:9349410-Pyramimonas_sp.AAC.1